MKWPQLGRLLGAADSSSAASCTANDLEEMRLLSELIELHTERLSALTSPGRCSGRTATRTTRTSAIGSVLPYHIAEYARFDHAGKIVVARLLSFKVRDYGKSSRPSYRNMRLVQMQVVACIDTHHRLSLYTISGEELISLDLEHAATSRITALGFDGEDVNYPTICTADSDGSVHVVGLEFQSSGMVVAGITARGRAVARAIAPATNATTAATAATNAATATAATTAATTASPDVAPITVQANLFSKFSLADTLAHDGAQLPYAVVLQLRSRLASASRERLLHIVDSTGTLHRVNTTGHPKIASLPIFSPLPTKSPLQVLAAQSGQMLALASRAGEIALISTSGSAFRRMGTCFTGIEGEIRGVAFGSGSGSINAGGQARFLYVKLDEMPGASSSVLKFDTKPPRGSSKQASTSCQLISVLGGGDEEEISAQDSAPAAERERRERDKEKRGKSSANAASTVATNMLFVHDGYLLTRTNTPSGCAVRGFNLTTTSSTGGSTLGDRVLAPDDGKGQCIIDASFPTTIASPSKGGFSAILGVGGPLNPLRSSMHSYGHASGDRFLLVAVPVPSTHMTRLIVYANRIPFPTSPADGDEFWGTGLMSILKGPLLLLAVLFFMLKWRSGSGASGLRDSKAASSLRGRGGRLTSREMAAREQWQRAQRDASAQLSSPASPPPVAGNFNADSLARLYDETQRLHRETELCPRDMDEVSPREDE